MQTKHFIAAIQEATDRTSFPLELEAIEWAVSAPYEPRRAFDHYTHESMGEDGELVVADAMLKGSNQQTDRFALVFNRKDWARMSLDQHHQIERLLERIILGSQAKSVSLAVGSRMLQ